MKMPTFSYNHQPAWNLYAEGRTQGIFQLESNLGRQWSKKVSPTNLEELSALVAIIRPGCLNVVIDGKNIAQHYVDRKNGTEAVTYLHPSLKNILESTQGVMIYQEQAMLISQQLAGFNLKEADGLRKAIGKKKSNLMAKIRTQFISGCGKTGVVTEDEGKEIFDQVEKSARYLFNKSHSLTYAVDSYLSAWNKAWFPEDFFVTYLEFAAKKSDTRDYAIYALVSEAKLFDIECRLPKLTCYDAHFDMVGNDIVFGIKDIKSLLKKAGDKILLSIKEVEVETGKAASEFTWMDVLLNLGTKIDATSFKALASIGFFDTPSVNVSRNKALYEYSILRELTDAEKRWVIAEYPKRQWTTLAQCFTDLAPLKKEGKGGTNGVERKQIIESEIQLIENPPYDLADDPTWIIDQEAKFAGCPISYARIDAADTAGANTTCKEIANGQNGKDLCVAGNITRVANVTIKKGKTKGQLMSFLTIEDETCSLDGVIVFPDTRKKCEYFLYEGNNLLFCGSVSKKDNSFIVDKIQEI